MITTYVTNAKVLTTGTRVIIATVPVSGLCQIRATITTSALVGAPSAVFELMNDDANYMNNNANSGPLTAVTDPSGTAIATPAVTTATTVELFSKYPANCREVVDLTYTNTVAASGMTVTVAVTVTEVV